MRKRSRYAEKAEINIVPLLDVLLVLVLIFMATVPIITQSVEVDLPQSTQSQVVSTIENRPIILEVSKQGYTLVLDTQERWKGRSQNEITAKIKELLLLNPNSIFLIGGSKDVPYNDVIKALNFLQSAGVDKVSLMTQPIL